MFNRLRANRKTPPKILPENQKMNTSPLSFRMQREGDEANVVVASSGTQTRNSAFYEGRMVKMRVNSAGIRTDSYERNPVLLYEHGWGARFPIGTAEVWHDEQGRLLARLQFHRETEDATTIAKLWDLRVLNAVSIHIIPDENDIQLDREADELILGSSDLIELSVVEIPADKDATRLLQTIMSQFSVSESETMPQEQEIQSEEVVGTEADTVARVLQYLFSQDGLASLNDAFGASEMVEAINGLTDVVSELQTLAIQQQTEIGQMQTTIQTYEQRLTQFEQHADEPVLSKTVTTNGLSKRFSPNTKKREALLPSLPKSTKPHENLKSLRQSTIAGAERLNRMIGKVGE